MDQAYSALLEDHDQALVYAMKAYEERPDNIEVNQMMAQIYIQKGMSEEAWKYLEVAFRTSTKDPDLLALKTQLATL